MRIFAASLATETNTFSPIPTSRANFEASAYFPAGQHPDRATLCTAPLYVARRRAKAGGFELIEGSCFWAEPSGTCAKADYESMRDEILGAAPGGVAGRRRAPRPARRDGGAWLRRLRGRPDRARPRARRAEGRHRRRTRPALPPDREAHRGADISILFKEYPHTDFVERAEELVTLVVQGHQRRDQAGHVALRLPHDRAVFPTTREPGRSFVDQDDGARGVRGRRALGLARPWLPACRRAGFRHAHARRHDDREGRRRQAREDPFRGGERQARRADVRSCSPPKPRSSGRSPAIGARRWSPTPPTMRAAGRLRTIPTCIRRLSSAT